MITFKLILSPVDFSETSTHALQTAIELASQLNADLHLVHVYQFPAFSIPEADLATPVDISIQKDYEKRLEQQLEDIHKKYSDSKVKIDSTLVEGVPYIEIVRTANDLKADLIVLGTHGRTGIAHMLLGSVAERVVRTSKIPVLSVPHKDHE